MSFAYCNALIFFNMQNKVEFLCSYTKYTELLLDFHTAMYGYSASDQFLSKQLLTAYSPKQRKTFRSADESIKDDDIVTGFFKM